MTQTRHIALLTIVLACIACTKPAADSATGASQTGTAADAGADLAKARAGVTTQLIASTRDGQPAPTPPAGVLDLIHYDAPAGKLAAYLPPKPTQPGKHPAIIWISGGDSNTIGDFWSPQPRENDQSAAAFRAAGIVTMYPSLRGGNDNPGTREAFFGEVQDILAAADHLAKLDYVDPKRIYLGGHSTGGTLVLLVAQIDPRFRDVFSFGPVADVAGYGAGMLPVSLDDEREIRLRSPGYWLDSIRSPVFVFEGDHDANTDQIELMGKANRNPKATFFVVPRADHFSVLAPATELIAKKILADQGATTAIAFDRAQIDALMP